MSRKHQSKHELELTHAPDVDPTWTEAFILEARLQDVPGRHIGDALAEINSHIVESGESPHDAFGDPKEYAIALAKDSPKVETSGMLHLLLPSILQVVGMLGALNALPPALDGEPFELTVGMIALVAVLGAAFGLLAWRSVPIIRLVVHRPWLAFGINFMVLLGFVGLLFIPGVVAALPAWWVVGVGLATLVVGTVYGLAQVPATADEDLIESPVAGIQPRRSERWPSVLPNLLVPAFTVVFGAVILLFG